MTTGQTISGSEVAVTLTDLDVLNCPICLVSLTVPVYQCVNGHILCSPCCLKLKEKKCPYCSLQIGHIRNRAIERVLESLKVPCRNKKYGCMEKIACSEMHKHIKKLCTHAPCSCPVRLCKFVGSSLKLKTHCKIDHAGAGLIKRFSYDCVFSVNIRLDEGFIVIQERTTRTVFLLHNRNDHSGNAFFVTRFGSICCKKGSFYDLITRDETGSITLQSQTEIVQGMVSDFLPKKVLMVPKSAFGVSKKIKLELCIWLLERIRIEILN